ncbi:MAG: hypothetical protein JO327_06295 [Nitrososphaeraceae archaeon]|nr:hypothetical protein [Nitrososphaeraceae archaeon]MBV9667724.1 hypothetical protein [Nitrososphaeraceae archaeon]
MARLETWISLASLGMAIMFVALLISFYLFLEGQDKNGPRIYVEPEGILIQIISISGVPSLILAGIIFGFQKTQQIIYSGILLIAAGIVLISGMAFAATIIPNISSNYRVVGIDSIPYIFIIGGISVVCLGCYFVNSSKKYRRNLEDEIH